jgi:2-polyprenyl-3-methyl-5-hydroxy-6-metoxy-1,4-benzoquinol methylase
MNREEWNARYGSGHLHWGLAPNRFVAAETEGLAPGTALDLACGEGRNAIWLAEHGWRVRGIDYADVAIERARGLAADRGFEVDFEVGDVLEADLAPGSYDLVLLAYVQLPPDERRLLLDRSADAVAPGGTLLLVGHHARNLADGTGGPSSLSRLWETAEVRGRLEDQGLEIVHAGEVLRDVDGADRPAIDLLVRATRSMRA